MLLENLLLAIGLALILARFVGYLLEKIKQPAVIGEILAGIIIGPFVLGKIFDIQYLSPETEALGQLGIILLLFLSGLEIGLDEIKSASKNGFITTCLDASFAFLFGFIAGHILGYNLIVSVAIGNILVATSVGISVKTLMDMKALHSKVGELILTVAVLDDVFGIVILSITLGHGGTNFLILKVMLFFLIFLAILLVFNKVKNIKLHIPNLILTSSLAFLFLFSALAKMLGLAVITGSFFAGLLLSESRQRRKLIEFTRRVGEIFFIPLFFVWVGASFDFYALKDIGILVLLFIPMAMIGKILGCSLGAKICGFKSRDALAVGIGMMPRLEVALVVVTTEISMGVFSKELSHQILAATVLLVMITSLVTPFLLKIVYKK
jgi:Kef-type K+ transport system membrane component KefB